MTSRLLPLFLLFALVGAGFAFAQEEGGVGPAPVAEPLKGDEALVPLVAPAAPGPVEKVSTVEPLGALPTEEQVRQQALDEAEARRPPPLKPRTVPQRVDVLAPGRMLILPRESPVEGGTVSGQMFSDDTETVQPVATPPLMLEPLIGQMNTQAEALERVVADMEARMDAMETASPTDMVSQSAVVTPTEAVVPKPEKLPGALSLPFMADMTGLGPANAKKLEAWLEKVGSNRKVKVRITAHALEPSSDGLGEDPAKLAERRAAAVKAAVAKAGLQVSGRIPVVVLRLKPGATGGQRLVVSASE